MFLEKGVKEHWVHINPNTADDHNRPVALWAQNHGYTQGGSGNNSKEGYSNDWMKVGGPKSKIQLGKSKYQFFYNSVDEYLKSGRLDKNLSERMDKAIK